MNKLHVSLLVILCAVSGLNAGDALGNIVTRQNGERALIHVLSYNGKIKNFAANYTPSHVSEELVRLEAATLAISISQNVYAALKFINQTRNLDGAKYAGKSVVSNVAKDAAVTAGGYAVSKGINYVIDNACPEEYADVVKRNAGIVTDMAAFVASCALAEYFFGAKFLQ